MGYTVSDADPGLFYKDVRGERIFHLVYVDDLFIAAKNLLAVNQVKERLKKAFDIRDVGEARMSLGFKI